MIVISGSGFFLIIIFIKVLEIKEPSVSVINIVLEIKEPSVSVLKKVLEVKKPLFENFQRNWQFSGKNQWFFDILEPGLRVKTDYDFGEPSVKAPNWVFDVGELLLKGSYRYLTTLICQFFL